MTESAVVNEILEEGQLQAYRAMLLDNLRVRFPEILTPQVERAIADQPNLALMQEWCRVLFRATSGEAFLAVLNQ